MRIFLSLFLLGLATSAVAADPTDRPPNVVLLFVDDLAYGDLGCYGSKMIRTPNIDRLAKQGGKFTDFYVTQAVCTASRASLMTGCYANRVSMSGALNHLSRHGIGEGEKLISEMFKEQGYATAAYGKWHLGTLPRFFPTRRGFDEWVGIPYSNDNGPLHPTMPKLPPLPFYKNDKVIETDPDQSLFTRRLTEHAVDFIGRNKDKPFFLYVPHIMPHVPIFASEKFKGRSGQGLYADVVEEIDWGVGEVMAALEEHGLEENTLLVMFSDNGPFLSYGNHAGNAGPLREGKLTTFEGGVRMPFIARWPGKIQAGTVCSEVATSMDLLPTCAALIGGKLSDNTIDGHDIRPLLFGEEGAKSPYEAFYYYAGTELQAVRSGKWKLHLDHPYLTVAGEPGRDGKPANLANMKPESLTLSGIEGIASRHGYRVESIKQSLFDLEADIGETRDVSAAHPEVVKKLLALAEKAREELGDSLTDRKGKGVREHTVQE